MERSIFTAKDVHTCFPWISGTTLFNRVRKGLLPTEPGPHGSGYAFQFSREGLVHVGVVDELCALGAWRELTPLSKMEVHFVPEARHKDYGRHKPRELTREPLYFYHVHRFFCRVQVDILHRMESLFRSSRQKVSPRIYRVIFHYAHDPGHPDSYPLSLACIGGLVDRTNEPDGGERLDSLSGAVVNVNKIWHHIADKLQLDP
jgi:hypothetical protein